MIITKLEEMGWGAHKCSQAKRSMGNKDILLNPRAFLWLWEIFQMHCYYYHYYLHWTSTSHPSAVRIFIGRNTRNNFIFSSIIFKLNVFKKTIFLWHFNSVWVGNLGWNDAMTWDISFEFPFVCQMILFFGGFTREKIHNICMYRY